MAGQSQGSLFGEIAIAMRLLTREQLAECVIAQMRSDPPRRIGDVCRDKGYLSEDQVGRVLAYQKQLVQQRKGKGAAAKRSAPSKAASERPKKKASRAAQRRGGAKQPEKPRSAAPKPVDRTLMQRHEVLPEQLGSGNGERGRPSQGPGSQGASLEAPSRGTFEVEIDWGASPDSQEAQRFPPAAEALGQAATLRGQVGDFLAQPLPDALADPIAAPEAPLHPQPAPVQARPREQAAQLEDFPLDDLPPPEAPRGPAPDTARSARPSDPVPAETTPQPPLAEIATTEDTYQRPPPRGDRPAKIDTLLRKMVEAGCSDLHLVTGMPPLGRLHGKMCRLTDIPPFPQAELKELLFEIITDRAYEQFCSANDADFAYAIEGLARYRANYFLDRKGIGAVFRFIPYEILRPEQIGLPAKVLELCKLSKGLVLVTGPTGSGKSTTLASLVDLVNRTRDDHIITIEDPVEFVHDNKRCLVNQREIGTHTASFKSALRAALREDPDIVLVGEMRDLETVSIAIETAETGHLVFGTLHTTTAATTVDRIIDQFPADQQAQIRIMLSGSLRGVIAQVLCAKRGGGRVAAYEVLMGNPAVSNLIREAKTPQLVNIMQTGRNHGMQTMNDHLVQLTKRGEIEPQEAYFKTYDKMGLLQAFKDAGIHLET